MYVYTRVSLSFRFLDFSLTRGRFPFNKNVETPNVEFRKLRQEDITKRSSVHTLLKEKAK